MSISVFAGIPVPFDASPALRNTAGEATKGIGIPAKTIIFMAQKGLTKAVDVIPPSKGGRQRRYIIKTRKFCSELGIPFVPEGGDNNEQR